MALDLKTTRVTLAPELVARNNEDGTIVIMKMDESNTFYKIDGVAATVWKSLNDGLELEQILSSITKEYDVEQDTLNKDVEVFLKDLESRGLAQLS